MGSLPLNDLVLVILVSFVLSHLASGHHLFRAAELLEACQVPLFAKLDQLLDSAWQWLPEMGWQGEQELPPDCSAWLVAICYSHAEDA